MPAPSARARLRRIGYGLATVLGVAPRGFFIPYRHAGAVAAGTPYAAAEAAFAACRAGFAATLEDLSRHAAAFAAIAAAGPARWDQDWFPRLDAAVAYAIVRAVRPARVVEVGSGHSTRFLARAVADGGLPTRIQAIDPAPRAQIRGLPAVEPIYATLQAAIATGGGDPFADLGPGDIVFIDSSHVLMPGSDVDILLNRVLPRLRSGVLVHIHDVFLPEDYPRGWAWRGYNEQQAVLPLLTGGGWSILFASRYAVRQMSDAVGACAAARLPLAEGALESSLWLKKG